MQPFIARRPNDTLFRFKNSYLLIKNMKDDCDDVRNMPSIIDTSIGLIKEMLTQLAFDNMDAALDSRKEENHNA